MKSNAELRNVKKSCERMIRFLSILAALLVVICVNFGVGADQPLIQKSDLYWISYIGQNEDQSCCLLFLMQIDQFGNVIRQPSIISRHNTLQTGTAIAPLDQDKLSIWAANRRKVILRAKVDKKTLHDISIKKTALVTADPWHLQVTHQKDKDFLTMFAKSHNSKSALTAFGISETGIFDGTRWPLSPSFFIYQECIGFQQCVGGVSSDGRSIFFLQDPPHPKINLAYQRLGAQGRPLGETKIVGNEWCFNRACGGIPAADITKALLDGKRYIVYIDNKPIPESSDKLVLQIVDSKTGERYADPIKLRTILFYPGQSVAVDPLGRFVIFTFSSGPNTHLAFQALDATGHTSGEIKILDANGITGVDILKD